MRVAASTFRRYPVPFNDETKTARELGGLSGGTPSVEMTKPLVTALMMMPIPEALSRFSGSPLPRLVKRAARR
jgi:hypothetical protein